ncbi:RNA polymerase sigma factor [Emticicia agri]|nr:RNA polymerase sigma factor [Emticicia agri]
MECLSDCTAQEKTWIEGCAQHNAVSQEKLFKHFFGFAMGICLRYLPDKALAQEALNDAFLKIFNLLPYEYKKLSSFRAWARRIIIHTAIDYFRKEKKHFYHNDHDLEESSQQENFFDRESAEEIIRLLNQLPPLWKVVFNLYEIEGYSHDEIAQMMHIPASSCRTYLTRAKQQLRVLINTHNRTMQ